MRMTFLIACLCTCLLAGCSTFQLLQLRDESASNDFDFQVSDGKPGSVSLVPVPPEIRQDMIQMELQEFGKPGAQVRVYTESEPMSPSTTGTIHQITNDELVLRNCITRAAVPTPDGQLQCQTTHTPEMSFAIHDLTDFTCLAEASNPDSATQSNQELSAVIGVIYRDGRQQTWGKQLPSDD